MKERKQTKNPKQSTRDELIKLANQIHQTANMPDEPDYLFHLRATNYRRYCIVVANNIGIKLSDNTIRKSVIHIENMVNELKMIDNEKRSLKGYIKEIKTSLSIVRIVVELNDGSKKIFIEEKTPPTPVVIPKPIVIPTPVQSGSLFNGSIITRGKHIGCDVKSKSSILNSFGDYKTYRKWLITLSSPGITGKLNGPTVTDDTIKLRNLIIILDNYLKSSDTL